MNNHDRILVDTGPIVAIFSSSDARHESCVAELRKIKGPLLTCWPVITEAAWLLRTQPELVSLLLSSFKGKNPLFELVPLGVADLALIAEILAKYSSLRLQVADACLVHLAGREEIQTIFTLDRRDFGVMRSIGAKTKFRLIP